MQFFRLFILSKKERWKEEIINSQKNNPFAIIYGDFLFTKYWAIENRRWNGWRANLPLVALETKQQNQSTKKTYTKYKRRMRLRMIFNTIVNGVNDMTDIVCWLNNCIYIFTNSIWKKKEKQRKKTNTQHLKKKEQRKNTTQRKDINK